MSPNKTVKNCLVIALFSLITIFFLYAMYLGTLTPIIQMNNYIKNSNTSISDVSLILKKDSVFLPYTYSQSYMRKDLLDRLLRMPISPNDLPILDQAISKMEQSMQIQNSNLNNYILLALAYIKRAEISKNSDFLKKSDEYYKKAIESSPNQQKLLVAYSGFLFDNGQKDDAIKLLEYTVSLDDKAPFPNFYLGLAKTSLGESYYTEALDNLEKFFNSDFHNKFEEDFLNPDLGWVKSKNVYMIFLSYFYRTHDVKNVLVTVKRLSLIDKDKTQVFEDISSYIENTGQLPIIKF